MVISLSVGGKINVNKNKQIKPIDFCKSMGKLVSRKIKSDANVDIAKITDNVKIIILILFSSKAYIQN